MRDRALALAVSAGLLLALLAAALATVPAGATMPPKRCGKAEVGGKTYKINAHLIGCDRARKASIEFLQDGSHDRSWDCTRYSPQETKVAFTCRKGSKDYYAVRK